MARFNLGKVVPEKGVDYFTQTDVEEIISEVVERIPAGGGSSGGGSGIDADHKLSSDLVDDTNHTNKFVTTSEKESWNNKGTYNKPINGIPKTDLSSGVQTSLDKADNSVQKETGKGLSTEDFTTAEKSKLAGIEAGATNNTNDITDLKEIIGVDVDTFSTSSTYAVGDIVIYNNKIYKCTTAVTVAGAWDISNWTNISIMDYQLLQVNKSSFVYDSTTETLTITIS